MIIHARELRKTYPQGRESLEILRGVSLEITRPQTLAIMGRSGCGKSTFISLLAGLDEPTSGKVEIIGQDLSSLSGGELNRFRARHIGIVFQQFHLLDHLTALENARLALDLNRVADADEKAMRMLERVGLKERCDHFPDQLSRGECQRVAIARVLVMKPEVLLADEPTGSLDVKTGREVIDLIFQLAKDDGFTLVMATHDPGVAERCERVLFMSEGLLGDQVPKGFGR